MSEALRVLAITAHPDDLEFGCGGSIARWVDEGAEATLVVATDGSTGTTDVELFGERLADVRKRETLEAAAILGVSDVRFLGYRDGYVEPTLDLRRDLAREYRRARPHRLVAMDPMPVPGGWFVNHPDHRAVGQATLDVTITAGTTPGHFPELLDEGFEPWRELREIYVAGPGGGETAVDIASTFDRKVRALQAHVSQVGEYAGLEEMLRGWAKMSGEPHGLDCAELFHVITPI